MYKLSIVLQNRMTIFKQNRLNTMSASIQDSLRKPRFLANQASNSFNVLINHAPTMSILSGSFCDILFHELERQMVLMSYVNNALLSKYCFIHYWVPHPPTNLQFHAHLDHIVLGRVVLVAVGEHEPHISCKPIGILVFPIVHLFLKGHTT